MTTFQHLDVTASLAMAGDDAMELSTDFDRRYLGDNDIDIDLGPDGRSPYAQEDEYMLEDTHSPDDRALHGSQADGNDDEMTDEVVVPGIITDGHGQDNNIRLEEQDEFDILVDDEDLDDVDNSMAIPDGILPQPTSSSQFSDHPSEHQTNNNFGNHLALNMTPEVRHGILYDSERTAQDLTTLDTFLVPGKDHLPGDRPGSTDHKDVTGTPSASPGHRETENRPPNEEKSEYANEHFFIDADVEPKNEFEGDVAKQSENQDREKERKYDLEGVGIVNESGNLTEQRESNNDEVNRVINGNASGHSSEVSFIVQETSNHDRHQDVSNTDVQDGSASDILNQDKGNQIDEGVSVRTRASLHPVVVLYQQSEIFLFPPLDNDEQYAQTYFLEDESLANQNLKVLFEALRLVLADSINEHDELEIKFLSLGLDICESSIASSKTSLSQIVDIYLQLQQNDGKEHSNALQMVLGTKLGFSNRLEYLYGAIAGGMGFLDIAISEKTEETDKATEQDERHGGVSQNTSKSLPTESEKQADAKEQEVEGYDGTEDLLPDNRDMISNEQNRQREFTQAIAQEALEPQHQVPKEVDLQKEPKSDQEFDRITSSKQEYDQIRNSDPPEEHSNSHTHDATVLEAGFPQDHIAEQDTSGEHDDDLQPPSSASSTLGGDEPDNVASGSYGLQPDNIATNNDDNNLDRAAAETDDDHWSIVDASEDEDSKELYDEDLDNHSGTGPEDATAFDTDTDQLKSGLNLNHIDHGIHGKDEDLSDTTNLTMSRQGSGGPSELDNDEITYEEEDVDEFEEENGEARNATTRSSNLSAEEQDSENSLHQNHVLAARRDSLKRLRPGEDDELSTTDNTQGMKRFRSE